MVFLFPGWRAIVNLRKSENTNAGRRCDSIKCRREDEQTTRPRNIRRNHLVFFSFHTCLWRAVRFTQTKLRSNNACHEIRCDTMLRQLGSPIDQSLPRRPRPRSRHSLCSNPLYQNRKWDAYRILFFGRRDRISIRYREIIRTGSQWRMSTKTAPAAVTTKWLDYNH